MVPGTVIAQIMAATQAATCHLEKETRMAKKKKAVKKTRKSKKSKKAGKAKKAKKGKKAKKAKRKKGRRTVLYSSKGKKLYAVRDAAGQFKDIQSYARAHAADIRKDAADKN